MFNKQKKKVSVIVYIQKASFTPLGYIVETEEQRKIAKLVSEGASKISDSPLSQLDLHHWLFSYLKKHTTVIGTKDIAEHHSLRVSFETKNGGIISMDITMGWSNITCDDKALMYLVQLLEEKGYSVDTKETAYGG